MKSTILRTALAAVVLAALPVVTNAGPPMSATAPRSSSDPLSLSAGQQKKMNELQVQARKDMAAVDAGKGTIEEKQKKKLALFKAFRDKQLAILTPTQRTRLQSLLAAQKAAGAKQRAIMLDREKKLANVEKTLTPQQKSKLKSIRAKYTTMAQRIWSNKNLSQGDKLIQLRAINDKASAESKAVLTSQQRAALPR